MEALEVCLLAVEFLCPVEAVPAQVSTKVRVAQQPVDPVGQRDLVEDVDEEAGLAIDAPILDASDPGGDDRRHVRVGLDPDEAERLEPHRGDDDRVGRRVVARGVGVAGVETDVDARFQAEA